MPAGGPHVRPPALLLRGDNLRSLLHDRHRFLVLLLAGPQSGKFSPLIGWRENAQKCLASHWLADKWLASHWPEVYNLRSLLHDRHCLLVLLLVGPQGGKCSPLIGWRRIALLLIGQMNTIYVPCPMTVTVSWFSFWLDHKAVSARFSLAGAELSRFSLARGIQSTFPAP